MAQREREMAQREREMAQQERSRARDDGADRSRARSRRDNEDRDDQRREAEARTDLSQGSRLSEGGDAPVRPARPSSALPWSPGPEVRPSDARPPKAKVDLSGERKEEELDQPRRRQEADRPPVRVAHSRRSQSEDRDQEEAEEAAVELREQRRSQEEEAPPQRPRQAGGRHRPTEPEETAPTRRSAGSRVYEEYWGLLDEATAQSAATDAAGAAPVDVNVIASLVYWVATAKQRLGDEKLKELLELYLQSGHSRPGLPELLMHLHSIVAPAPEGAGQGALEWVDLMFQLHGILTGGLPIGRMPAVTLASKPLVTAPPPVAATPTSVKTTPAPVAATPAPAPVMTTPAPVAAPPQPVGTAAPPSAAAKPRPAPPRVVAVE